MKNLDTFIKEITAQVKAGRLSKKDANQFIALAMEEVQEAKPEPEETPVEEVQPEPAAKPAPSLEPQNQIHNFLTEFETDIGTAVLRMKKRISDLIKSTSGAAVPIGEFTISSNQNSAKLEIERVANSKAVTCTYSLKNDWRLENINITEETTASVEPTCHIPLRKETLATVDDIFENSENTLNWDRYELPLKALTVIASKNDEIKDPVVANIIKIKPSTVNMKDWRNWALASQTYLLAADYLKETGETVESLFENN